MAFLMSVPLHKQGEVSKFYDSLLNSRREVISWLRNLEARGSLDPAEFSRRVIGIIDAARRFAENEVRSGKISYHKGRKMSMRDITKRNISNFIMKEEGSSLYRLVREMNKWKKEQVEKATE